MHSGEALLVPGLPSQKPALHIGLDVRANEVGSPERDQGRPAGEGCLEHRDHRLGQGHPQVTVMLGDGSSGTPLLLTMCNKSVAPDRSSAILSARPSQGWLIEVRYPASSF